MPETAIVLPLDGAEIRQIILERLEQRMQNNSLLATGIAYPGFEYDLSLKIRLDHASKPETLVWDRNQEGTVDPGAETTVMLDGYQSKPPNVERQDHGLPLTVEATDARGKKSFKKVRIKE